MPTHLERQGDPEESSIWRCRSLLWRQGRINACSARSVGAE